MRKVIAFTSATTLGAAAALFTPLASVIGTSLMFG